MLLRYLVLTAIALAYLAIFAFARTPAVSDAYRAYYIDKADISWTYQGDDSYLWGQLIDLRQPLDILASGWGDPEHFGRWTVGDVSEIRLPLGEEAGEYEGPACMTIRGELMPQPANHPATSVTFHAQGQPVGKVSNESQRHVFDQFPFEATPAKELHLALITNAPVVPARIGQSDDQRELGLSVFNIWVENIACRHAEIANR